MFEISRLVAHQRWVYIPTKLLVSKSDDDDSNISYRHAQPNEYNPHLGIIDLILR